MNQSLRPIAWFISAHGFGHAARSTAVMQVLKRKRKDCHFDIYTTVPNWFFQDSLPPVFTIHPIQTDVGLFQRSPFEADLNRTIRQLDKFYPVEEPIIQFLAGRIREAHTRCVVCDIAPLGILVAQAAGIPSILIENFTWDWIYQAYAVDHPEILSHIDYLRSVYNQANCRIQTDPVCDRRQAAPLFPPAGRAIRTPRQEIRNRLGILPGSKMVLITTGGIKGKIGCEKQLKEAERVWFVIPGERKRFERDGNLIFLPHQSDYYHPDLVNAADAVVGKAGYSTVAEVYQSRGFFGYVIRPDFRESERLADFIRKKMQGFPISRKAFKKGTWIPKLVNRLHAAEDKPARKSNGAEGIADHIERLL